MLYYELGYIGFLVFKNVYLAASNDNTLKLNHY